MKFIDNEIPHEPQRFQRIYIYFAACKLGFRAGCRKIVRVDGCWLKDTMFRTQLLSVVGMDGNNNIFHVAYAIVEKESKDTGLDILKLDIDAPTWLNDKDHSEWSMSHFSSDAKCDTLLNNLSEVFNGIILDARDKPIMTLLEKLRYIRMARMLANREKIAAVEYVPRKSNYWSYKILGATVTDNWAVDLQNKSCSCRKWSLTGIPCKHVIAAIWAKKDNILDYVHDCYKVETYRRIYENSIFPMNGPQLWPKTSKVPPLPPKIVVESGGKNIEVVVMTKEHGLKQLEEDEIDAIVA
ncbi:uncharacterized protein LOC142168931 [Nicotiana tabacum]|uniref:Uncharacterized protein LOC142168931 n=1 Tax=Nicotiana tabacum TaxID=4097 RepID=A0AC58SMN2_TOBAC